MQLGGAMKLRVATRKSALALAQTTMAADAIVAANTASNAEPLTYELVSMTTEGDRRLDKSLASFGGKGVFIKELEVSLLENRADIAIHSLKDMPAEVLPQFKLAAVLKREDPRDAFLSRGGAAGVRFMDLPAGARVGTGSIRRIVQLKALRPDIEYVPIRGNIQTRISKLAELDGVVLAAAGLKRMGLDDQVTEYFSMEQVLPASGQGILAIETLSDKVAEPSRSDLAQILSQANHVETFCVATAEMAYLKALDAGCQFPVASFAEFVSESASELKIRGIYWDEKSGKLLRAEVVGNVDLNSADAVLQSKQLGVALAQEIKNQL
jgi:hydroxymethylbilane synthase